MRGRRAVLAAGVIFSVVCSVASGLADEPLLRVSATELLSADLKAEHVDPDLNRGMLWVERGRQLWQAPAGAKAKSCGDCHGSADDGLKGVATRYPAVDSVSGGLLDIEARIVQCQTERQRAEPFARESDDLLALTALLGWQSKSLPVEVEIDGGAAPFFEAGRAFFHIRQGQLNLACTQCHDDNVGRKLRGDTISSGVTNGYPAYRLAWQGMGSLARRINACQLGVRAAPLDPAGAEQRALALYLAWRSRGLALEAPAMRR
jgi:sulfur-oxidizing protein SoxA